jgi:hypothetical protein
MPFFSASATRWGGNKDVREAGHRLYEEREKRKRRTLGDVAVEGIDDDCDVRSHG